METERIREKALLTDEEIDRVLRDSPFAISHELITEILPDIKRVAQAQAEITWHARDKEVEEARKLGREDVVDFVEAEIFEVHTDIESGRPFLTLRQGGVTCLEGMKWQSFKNGELR